MSLKIVLYPKVSNNNTSNCIADITGKSCELMKNLCVDNEGMPVCMNGGTCHQMGNSISCECVTGKSLFCPSIFYRDVYILVSHLLSWPKL